MLRNVLIVCATLFCLSMTGCGGPEDDGIQQLSLEGVSLFQAAENSENGGPQIDALLKNGVDVNAKDDMGQTALHHAAMADNFDGVKRLIMGGADLTMQNAQGQTAEQLAESAGKADALAAFDKYQ